MPGESKTQHVWANRRIGRRGLVLGGLAAIALGDVAGVARAAAPLKTPVYPTKVSPALADTASKGLLVWDVSPGGYVAEEYIVSGRADVYEPVSAVDAYDVAAIELVAEQ